MSLAIITPFSRTTANAERMRESLGAIGIRPHLEWIIVYEHRVEQDLNDWLVVARAQASFRITLLKGHTPTSYFGNSYRNQGLEHALSVSRPETWIYFLDDDNILHPAFPNLLQCLTDEDEAAFFSQVRPNGELRLAPTNIRIGAVDTAMFVARASTLHHYRWVEDQYTADGILAEQLTRNHKCKIMPETYCYYNYLRPEI